MPAIDLWCKTVARQVEFTDAAIKIEADPLPEALPEMMSDGQCTPQRLQADQDLLAATRAGDRVAHAGQRARAGRTDKR